LAVDDLLDHHRDSRCEPETHDQGHQQESGEGPEAAPEAARWSSRRLWLCGLRLLGEALMYSGPQPLRHLILRQSGVEQCLETTMGCHLPLTGVAGLEMPCHLGGLRGYEFAIEIEIELCG